MKRYDDHMRNCPKCEAWGISGPSFQSTRVVAVSHGIDIELRGPCMRWTCQRCGYYEYTKCKDAKEQVES